MKVYIQELKARIKEESSKGKPRTFKDRLNLRAMYLAYGYLRGKRYLDVENRTNPAYYYHHRHQLKRLVSDWALTAEQAIAVWMTTTLYKEGCAGSWQNPYIGKTRKEIEAGILPEHKKSYQEYTRRRLERSKLDLAVALSDLVLGESEGYLEQHYLIPAREKWAEDMEQCREKIERLQLQIHRLELTSKE